MEYYLGIDPGLSEVGFGIVGLKDREPIFVDCGIIKTTPDLPFSERLMVIKDDLESILKLYRYESVGVEELFFVKNITNGIKVSHARGVLIESIARSGFLLREFKPTEIKSNICGNGHADKRQMQEMVKLLLNLDDLPRPHDAADALGIAILTSRLGNR